MTGKSEWHEKRRFPRFGLRREAAVRARGKDGNAVTVNISSGGVLLETKSDHRLDDSLDVEIGDIIKAGGRVVRKAERLIGVQFAEEVDKKKVERALSDLADLYD